MTEHTPPTGQQLADLHQHLTGPLGTATDVCGGTALRLVAEVRDHRAAQPIALPARWDCAHGTADDEPFCAEQEDDGHVCPTIRVHPSDATAFAALVAEVHRLKGELAGAQEDVAWLRCLEAAGVDNWEGYDGAIEMRGE